MRKEYLNWRQMVRSWLVLTSAWVKVARILVLLALVLLNPFSHCLDNPTALLVLLFLFILLFLLVLLWLLHFFGGWGFFFLGWLGWAGWDLEGEFRLGLGFSVGELESSTVDTGSFVKVDLKVEGDGGWFLS